MATFKLVSIANEPRVELHDKLELTGAEISLNNLPADAAIPFLHHHKENEEIYLILEGSGEFSIDGEIVNAKKGDTLRIDPSAVRGLKAGAEGISYFCIQAKANSLTQFTMTDAVID